MLLWELYHRRFHGNCPIFLEMYFSKLCATISVFTRNYVSAILVQFLSKSTITSQIFHMFQNPLMKSYLMILNSKNFDFKSLFITRDKFNKICWIIYLKMCTCIQWSFLFFPIFSYFERKERLNKGK